MIWKDWFQELFSKEFRVSKTDNDLNPPQVTSPASEFSEKSDSGPLDLEEREGDAGFLVEGDASDARDAGDAGDADAEDAVVREYNEPTMQELLAIYDLTSGDLSKPHISGHLLPNLLNTAHHSAQGTGDNFLDGLFFQIKRIRALL